MMLGKTWAYLGLFRLHLLIPAHAVDPTAKFSVRLDCIITVVMNGETVVFVVVVCLVC